MASAPRLSAGLTAAALLAGLGAGVLAAAVPADASTHTLHRTFAARGLVVSRSAHSVTVLARTLKTGSSVRHNAVLKVAVPSSGHTGKTLTGTLRKSSVGDTVAVSGIASGSGRSIAFAAHGLADHSTPFHAYLGVVTSVGSNSLTVVKADLSSDDPAEDSIGGFTVDTSNATVSVDGSTAGSPAAGELVAILGSQTDDVIVATSVWAYSTLPDMAGGEVQSVDGSVVTLADRSQGGDDSGDDSGDDNPGNGSTTTVDLSSATLVLNGTSGSTADQLTEGTRMVVLGTTDATTGAFTADLALAFSHGCSSRHHGDGGRDDNGTGDDDGAGDDNGGGDNGGGA